MIQMLRKRLDRKDEGFTLIELMVVVLIIAILLAIAIPTFLGARSRAQNRAAESNLRNALTAEKTAYTDNSSYVANTAVQSVEPSLSFLASGVAPTGGNTVEVTTVDNANAVCLLGKSASGTYYGIFDVASPDASTGSFLGSGTFYGSGTSTLACPTATTAAGAATSASGSTWGNATSLGGW